MIGLLLAALVASPSPSPAPVVPATLPCGLLVFQAGLNDPKHKVTLTDGLGRLWSAAVVLHARSDGRSALVPRDFIAATNDVLACVNFGSAPKK